MKYIVMSMLLGWSIFASAEIYQWTDRAGNVHFGDSAAKARDPGLKAEKLDMEEATREIDPDAERNREQLRQLNEKNSTQRKIEEQRTAQIEQQERRLQQQCKAILDHIRAEQQVAYMFRYVDGQRVLWTAEERTTYRALLQEQKQQYCGTE